MIERMLNTVPSNTQLTEEIELLPVKVRLALITVVDSQLLFITSLRVSVIFLTTAYERFTFAIQALSFSG
jgi:hypothetical protein